MPIKKNQIEDDAVPTNAEIRDGYHAIVATVSQAQAEAGSSTSILKWTPQRVSQAIAALAPGGGGSPVEIEDEGVSLTTDVTKIDFAGAGVTVTEPVGNQVLVTIPGATGSAVEIEDETVSLTTDVTKINFEGTGVTVTEPVADEILVTIPGTSADLELIIPTTDHEVSGPYSSIWDAGATIAIIRSVRRNADGDWVETNATTEAGASGPLGLSLEAGTASSPMKVAMAGSIVRDDSFAFSATDLDKPVYLNTADGNWTLDVSGFTTGNAVRIVGYVAATNAVEFNPEKTPIIL